MKKYVGHIEIRLLLMKFIQNNRIFGGSISIHNLDPALRYSRLHDSYFRDVEQINLLESIQTQRAVVEQNQFLAMADLAAGGNPLAMCFLSRMFRSGGGVPMSHGDAICWAQKSANLKYAIGFYELGLCIEDDCSAKNHHILAAEQYSLSIDGGFGMAAIRLSHKHKSGLLPTQDVSEPLSIIYAKKAVELGESMGAVFLAGCYQTGDGVIQDDELAVAWYKRASEMGSFQGSAVMYAAYENGLLGLSINLELAAYYKNSYEEQLRIAENL